MHRVKHVRQSQHRKGADLTVDHLEDVRPSTLLFHLTKRLLYKEWRDPGEEPKLHLFGQLKRITKQWLDTCLVCKGGTYPALLLYQDLADMACGRITAGITMALQGTRPIKALLDPYNSSGSTTHVRFPTSKTDRWDTSGPPPKNHVNWVVLDSQWEAELCRVVEAHPRVVAYTKNHNLGFEVPYRHGSEIRRYRPDFVVLVDDGHGIGDPLYLVIETKGYRREDAKDKRLTMDTFWVPGVNNLRTFGRWAFAEFVDVYLMESDFAATVSRLLDQMIDSIVASEHLKQLTLESERALRKHFGSVESLSSLNETIWKSISASPDRRVRLSDFQAIDHSFRVEDILAVLGLLSNPSIGLLRMELTRAPSDDAVVQIGEFIDALKRWRRTRSMTDIEWEQWAKKVWVAWAPVLGEAAK